MAMYMTDFSKTRDLFHLPDGMIYLDGNSLGPLPKATPAKVEQMIRAEWGDMLITAWNKAGWMASPATTGDRLARMIGAQHGSVVVGDTLSIKIYQALASALALKPDRKVILSDTGNFPSDLYMAQGLIKSLAQGHELRLVAPNDVATSLTPDIAVLMLTEVDYQTGRLHDMTALTRAAHDLGIITVWDLAHSAGAIEVDLQGAGADFAAGCTYKYINAGPGAPAFIYVKSELQSLVLTALSGWHGHAAPFDFDLDYRPAPDIERMRVGTPAMLQFAALDAALDIWDQVDMADLRAQSIALTELFIKRVAAACPDLRLASPRDPHKRGSQVSFHYKQGYAAIQALIARGVIGDFRAPDIMRFGFTPLFIGEAEVIAAADHVTTVINDRVWDAPQYLARKRVT